MIASFLFLYFVPFITAQYPPSVENLTTIRSPADPSISISYKSPPTGTCKTAFDTQQQYTGWVNIPGNYSTNTFFWFIAGRDPTDKLTIWLNGGPGSSSMLGLFTENGPCEVVELAEGKFGTVTREFGWDRGSNMLYIDQVCSERCFLPLQLETERGGRPKALGKLGSQKMKLWISDELSIGVVRSSPLCPSGQLHINLHFKMRKFCLQHQLIFYSPIKSAFPMTHLPMAPSISLLRTCMHHHRLSRILSLPIPS